MKPETEAIHQKIRDRYSRAATRGGCCTSDDACGTDYSRAELVRIPPEAVLGLGSGNPARHANLESGEVVVDLGSGAGIDVFLAASLVGPNGRGIGVDMTRSMIDRARTIAKARKIENVTFHLAPIERIPIPEATANVVLSNCVINLAPDKAAVFEEAYRILKPGGRIVVSDVVQERGSPFADDDCGCVATAMIREDYLETIRHAGFVNLSIAVDRAWRTGPDGLEASALTIVAKKPEQEVTQ